MKKSRLSTCVGRQRFAAANTGVRAVPCAALQRLPLGESSRAFLQSKENGRDIPCPHFRSSRAAIVQGFDKKSNSSPIERAALYSICNL